MLLIIKDKDNVEIKRFTITETTTCAEIESIISAYERRYKIINIEYINI